jgi:hypothetical protein
MFGLGEAGSGIFLATTSARSRSDAGADRPASLPTTGMGVQADGTRHQPAREGDLRKNRAVVLSQVKSPEPVGRGTMMISVSYQYLASFDASQSCPTPPPPVNLA